MKYIKQNPTRLWKMGKLLTSVRDSSSPLSTTDCNNKEKINKYIEDRNIH